MCGHLRCKESVPLVKCRDLNFNDEPRLDNLPFRNRLLLRGWISLDFGALHSLLVYIGAIGPTVLAVPTHDITTSRVFDTDFRARLANADTGFDDKRDELLPLRSGRFGVMRAQLARLAPYVPRSAIF